MTTDEHRQVEAFAAAEGQGLLRFAYLLTGGNAQAAEDLVQSVLLRLLHRGVGDLESPVTFARRCLMNEHRSRGRRLVTARRALSRIGPADHDTGVAMDVVHEREVLLAALRQLSSRERSAVALRYLEDLADDEIAEVLGCTRSTVRSLVHRALPKLRAVIERETAEGAPSRREGNSHG